MEIKNIILFWIQSLCLRGRNKMKSLRTSLAHDLASRIPKRGIGRKMQADKRISLAAEYFVSGVKPNYASFLLNLSPGLIHSLYSRFEKTSEPRVEEFRKCYGSSLYVYLRDVSEYCQIFMSQGQKRDKSFTKFSEDKYLK